MNYYLTTRKNISFGEAIKKITKSLSDEGFGIISEIDLSEALNKKSGVDFKKYKILGAHNPEITYKAIMLEDKIGALFPCNLIVQECSEYETEISAVNPLQSMSGIDNIKLKILAYEAGEKLKKVLSNI